MSGSKTTRENWPRLRVELYLPFTEPSLFHFARSFIGDVFTYLFGGYTFYDELDGQYLNVADQIEADMVTVIVTDTPPYSAKDRRTLNKALRSLKERLARSFAQEDVLIVVYPVEHL